MSEKIKGMECIEVPDTSRTRDSNQPYSDKLPRGYLSVSQVTQYLKCGEAYRNRYVMEHFVPSNSYMVQGRGVHKAAEELHLSMIKGARISADEMVQHYVDLHDTEMPGAEIKEEASPGTLYTEGAIKDIGVRLTRAYHVVACGGWKDSKTGEALPAVVPTDAELRFRVNVVPEGRDAIPFLGVIDLVEADSISDLKTKTKAAPQAEADNSLQLSLYAHVTGKPHVRLDQLVKPTKKLGVRFMRTGAMRTPNEVKHALDVVADVAQDIAAGRFRRTNPENWWCTEKWCSYWDVCRGKKR